MKSFTEKLVPPEILRLFQETQRIVAAVPDAVFDEDGKEVLISCHHLARIVEHYVPELRCIDGYFIKGYEHSWLATPHPQFLFDPYPVALHPGPLLVATKFGSPWHKMYLTERAPSAITKPTFERTYQLVLAATTKHLI